MKRVLFYSIFFISIGLVNVHTAQAQDSSKNKHLTIEQKITDKNFTFVADWVYPMTGSGRHLTEYDFFTIKQDSIIADMPYFGRSYNAPVDPTNIGVHISSVGFDYSVVKKKKGSWDITITPKNRTEIQSFLLTIYSDGTAYLSVTNTNRDPISYKGYLEDKK